MSNDRPLKAQRDKPRKAVARSIFVSAFMIHPGLFRRYPPRITSGIKLSAIAPMIVMLPIHSQPDGPNGSSPIPYAREVTALRMKNGPVK